MTCAEEGMLRPSLSHAALSLSPGHLIICVFVANGGKLRTWPGYGNFPFNLVHLRIFRIVADEGMILHSALSASQALTLAMTSFSLLSVLEMCSTRFCLEIQ